MRRDTARWSTSAAASASLQRRRRARPRRSEIFEAGSDALKVRAGLFVRTALAAAALVLPALFASAQQIDMNVVDQPGYVPSPEEEQLSGAYEKQEVFFRTNESPGTVIIDTNSRFLYLVQPNNRALRYGIGVGREGFQWSGLQKISRKQEWPDWRPPPEMIERQPYLPRFMAGGPGNPLGARAMYLGQTVYRIHGTNQPETIGHAVSSGCFRLVNADVVDLYGRVPVGTKVIIKQAVVL
ncbi:MAG: L,D-transpeptidase [Hyphomicrobiales bacterium]|nr:L,D-transpeptidase [Hyphomicrobiales bacterium]